MHNSEIVLSNSMLVDKIGQRKNPSVLGKLSLKIGKYVASNKMIPNVSFTKILRNAKTNDSV